MKDAPATKVVARIVSDDPAVRDSSRRSKRSRAGQKASSLLITMMVLFMATMGFGGGAQPASAWGIDDIVDKMEELFCFGEVENAPAPYSSNSDSALIGARAPDSVKGSYSDDSVTAYEEYGTSGLFWSEYRPAQADGGDDAPGTADGEDGCITSNFDSFIGNMMANEMFSVTTTITSVTIGMFRWASNGDLLDEFTTPLSCVIEGCNGGSGLKTTLFLNYLMPIVMLGALWGAWNGLVKKKTTETAQGGLWMVGATAFALIFMANPGLVAEKSNSFVNEISTTITNGVTSATSSTVGKEDMCWVASGKAKGNRMAACSLYKAMLVTPWAAGQFGVPLGEELKGSTSVKVGNRSFDDLRIAQIEAQTVSHTELESGSSYKEIAEADAKVWESVRDDVSDGTGKASFMTWTGEQSGERVNIALASIIASLCLGILVILISFSTVVLAVGMILLIMMAPLFLLIGVHPGFGRGIALKWLELLIGTVVKRIVLSAVLAILVGMYQVILETPMPWFSQIALIMALGVGAIMFRKPLLETLNVIQLGGSRTGMEQGLGREGKKGTAAVAGAVSGGISGGMAGGAGSILGGAVKGGMMGSRSGSPVRAATMGSSAGRRVGSRNAGQAAAAERAKEQEQTRQQKAIQARIENDPFDPDAWRELEKWNKKHPTKQVQGPGTGGAEPYPQSYREAKEMEEERRNRGNNGGSGTPAPGGSGAGAGAGGAGAPGGTTGAPGAGGAPGGAGNAGNGGGVPTSPPNSGGGTRPQGVPTAPPSGSGAPAPGTTPPAGGGTSTPPGGAGTTPPGGAGANTPGSRYTAAGEEVDPFTPGAAYNESTGQWEVPHGYTPTPGDDRTPPSGGGTGAGNPPRPQGR